MTQIGNIFISPVKAKDRVSEDTETYGYSIEELKALARGLNPITSTQLPAHSVEELKALARGQWPNIYSKVQQPSIDVNETGLEQIPGVEYAAPEGVNSNFPLVPTQRSSGESLKPTFMAVGGTLGSVAGAPLGLAGMIAGGALGTGLGSTGYDIYRDIKRKFVNDPTLAPSVSERLLGPIGDMTTDALLSTGIAGLPALSAGVRAITRKGLKIDDSDSMIAKEALSKGVPIGIADLKYDEGPARAYINTIGRMPWLGGPAREARDAKLSGWQNMWDRELGLFGPPIDAPEISKKAVQSAENAWKAFRAEANNQYSNARKLAASEGPIVDSQLIKDSANKIQNELLSNRPVLMSGETAHAEIPDYVMKFTDQLQELPNKLTVGNLDWIKSQLDVVAKKAEKDGFQWKNATDIIRATEKALRDAAPNSPAVQALIDADRFFAKGKALFETPTGQRFERTDKNIFSLGYNEPGKINSDDMNRIILNAKSPQAIADLERLVGKSQMGNIARKHIEDAVNAAKIEDKTGKFIFNVGDVTNKFKLNDPKSSEYQAFARLLKSAGIDVNDFKRVLDITKIAFGNEVPDVSTFIARAMTLGAGTGALGATAAVSPHVVPFLSAPALIAGLIARHGTKLLSNPNTLRKVLKVYDSNLPAAQKRMLLLRMYQGLSGEAGALERERSLGLFPQKLPNVPSGELTP